MLRIGAAEILRRVLLLHLNGVAVARLTGVGVDVALAGIGVVGVPVRFGLVVRLDIRAVAALIALDVLISEIRRCRQRAKN